MPSKAADDAAGCPRCTFPLEKPVSDIRRNLLEWYDRHQRELPWRQGTSVDGQPIAAPSAHGTTNNTRAYAVWVSEVMLQQTQVATVVRFYTKWMSKWPTVAALAAASLEQVNEVWAGLGYYSRARRLHEGAVHVMEKLAGHIPQSMVELQKLPGIGPYTAAAIASIAFGEVTGLVDGNVIRVLTRLRAITAEVNSSSATAKHLWALSNRLVDPSRPGDFNQAVMELGATVCHPKKPLCHECPVRANCNAQNLAAHATESTTADNGCAMCAFDPDSPLDIESFPVKRAKKKSTEHCYVVLVVESQNAFLMTQRQKGGLLAGMWEFPNLEISGESEVADGLRRAAATVGPSISDHACHAHGTVEHVFSHRRHTYHVFSHRDERLSPCREASEADEGEAVRRWLTAAEIGQAAVPTNMKKVFRACTGEAPTKRATKRRKTKAANVMSISKYFKKEEQGS